MMGASYPVAYRSAARKYEGGFQNPRVLTPANDNNPFGPRPFTAPKPANDNRPLPAVDLPSPMDVARTFAFGNPYYRAFKLGWDLYDLYRRWGEITPGWSFTDAGWLRLCGPVSFPTDFPDPCNNWPSMPWFAPLGTPDSCGAIGQSFTASQDPTAYLTGHNLLRAQKRADGVVCAGGDFAVTDVWFRPDADPDARLPQWVRPDIPRFPREMEGLDPFRYTRPLEPRFEPEPYYKPGDGDRYDPQLVEQSDRSYAAPPSPIDWEATLPDVLSSDGRAIGRQPPRAREKEKKVRQTGLTKYALHALILAAKVNGKMRDFKDYVDAFWKNIPKKHRTKHCKTFGCKLADIWNHWDEIDGTKAFLDMIKEIAEDVVGGAAEQLRDEAAKKNGWFKYKVFLNPRF